MNKVCVCVCSVEKKNRQEREKKVQHGTQRNRVGTRETNKTGTDEEKRDGSKIAWDSNVDHMHVTSSIEHGRALR